jgi:RNA polymerase sigma factor for flagellar operon FliA
VLKGAIIDELLSLDWVPRSVRAKARAIERAYSKLENELHRTPDDHELARELGMGDAELSETLSQISFVGLVALDEILAAGGDRPGRSTIGDMVAGPNALPGGGVRGRRDAPPAWRRDQSRLGPRAPGAHARGDR